MRVVGPLVLATALPVIFPAQAPTCPLLVRVEVRAAAGDVLAKRALTMPGTIAAGHANDKPIRLCSWVGPHNTVRGHVTLVSGLSREGEGRVVTLLGGELNLLRLSGWPRRREADEGLDARGSKASF